MKMRNLHHLANSSFSGEAWILAADVFRCEAPGRFIIGLVDHVKILHFRARISKTMSRVISKNTSRLNR